MKDIRNLAALGLLTASAALAQPPGKEGDGPMGLSGNVWIGLIAVLVIVIAIVFVKNKKR